MPFALVSKFAISFLAIFSISYYLTRVVRKVALDLSINDIPDHPRKIHTESRPKLGGVAIFVSFTIGLLSLSAFGFLGEISSLRIAGFLIGGAILIIGGALDDRYDLTPLYQFLFPVAAALTVVLSGSHISFVTNPLGGKIILDQFKIFGFPVLGSLLVFSWVLGMTYTTKFLDGMDGLVSGISGIAALAIFGLSLRPEVNQTTTAFIALVFAAACFGFLPHNWNPSKIFLGEGGSTFTGFIIGVLAVISGGKIATALLVLGIPILDVAWVIVRRLWFGTSPFRGDRKHLHFRLLDIGLTQRQAVLFLYSLSIGFGGIAIFLQSMGKLVALGTLFAIMILVALGVVMIYRKKNNDSSSNF